jgi:hypothetical protein
MNRLLRHGPPVSCGHRLQLGMKFFREGFDDEGSHGVEMVADRFLFGKGARAMGKGVLNIVYNLLARPQRRVFTGRDSPLDC